MSSWSNEVEHDEARTKSTCLHSNLVDFCDVLIEVSEETLLWSSNNNLTYSNLSKKN